MNRFLLVFSALVLLAAKSTPVRAAVQAYGAGHVDMAVDGTWVGVARSVSGGDPRGSVVIEKPNGTPQKKSIGGVAYAPIMLEMDLPLSPVLLSWITDFCANKDTKKTLLLTTSNSTASNATTLQAIDTTLSEVRIPAVNAASKEGLRITFVFSPGSTNAGGTPPPTGTIAYKQATASNFRFTLTGLNTTKVSKIEAFTLKRSDSVAPAGEVRDYTIPSGAVNFPNLVVTVSGVFTDWNTWRQDFLINGKNDDAAEKNGLFELLASDLKTTIFSLQLSHVGLIRVTPSTTDGTDAIGTVEAELYVESMTTAASAGTTFAPESPKKGSVVENTGKTKPTKTVTDPTRPTESSKADDPTVTTASSSGAADRADPTKPISDPTLTATDGKKGNPTTDNSKLGQSEKADPTKSSSDPTQITADEKKGDLTATVADPSKPTERADPTKSANDPALASPVPKKTSQATRDIVDFPKPDDAVRKSYNVYRSPNSTQETASYNSKSSMTDTVAFYASGLEAAGWSEGNRLENDNAAGDQTQVVMHWAKKLRTASITVIQQKEGGVVINITEVTNVK